jgi:hypothetical protein
VRGVEVQGQFYATSLYRPSASIQVIGVNGDRPSHPSAWCKDKPVYSSHRLLKNSTNPSGRHLHAMAGMESIIIRSLSSGGFRKRGHADEPTAMGRLLLGALAPIILNWPRSVQRGESAPPLDFDGTGNAWSPAQHLLLTAGESPFSCPRWMRWFGASNLEFVSLESSAQETAYSKDGETRSKQIVGRGSALGSSPGDSHI